MKIKFIDLTIPIETGMPNFPILPKVDIRKIRSLEKDGDTVRTIYLPTHVGTHIDAPSHQVENSLSIDKINLNRFAGEAIILDFSHKYDSDNTLISLPELEVYKNKIKEGDIVLINTGTYKHPKSFNRFGHISEDVADFFVRKKILLLGVDCPSVDINIPLGKKMPIHQIILGSGIPIIEGLINLDKIKTKRFIFIGIPLNIKNGDGSPCRAIAIEGLL